MPEPSKATAIVLLLTITLGGAATAAEALLNTDIPAEVIAREARFLNLSASQPAATHEISDPELLLDSIIRYENSISDLQKSHGVFHDQIGEELIGLGLAYKNLGQLRESARAFNRALQINRINHGLHNSDQLPILDLIIDINTANGDWEALDQNYHLFYWVNRRIYGQDDPRLLPVINRLGRWHLNAYTLESDPVPFRHLVAAEELYQDAVEIIEARHGSYNQQLINPLHGIAMTNYHIAIHASTHPVNTELGMHTNSISRMERLLEEEEARQELISNAYRAGKKAMLRIIDIYSNNPELPEDGHGMAMIYLGDWYLLFNRRTTAADTYSIAYAKLEESGMPKSEIDQLLGQPRSLPAQRLTDEFQRVESDSDYVIARFDVTKTGLARNIEIIESNPTDDVSLQRRAKNTIRATRFRPRFENGQPVATPGVNIKYVLPD